MGSQGTQTFFGEQNQKLRRLCWTSAFSWSQFRWFNHDRSFCFVTIAFQARYFTASINTFDKIIWAFCNSEVKLEQQLYILTTQDARQEGITSVDSNNATIPMLGQTLSDIITAQKRLAKQWIFFSLGHDKILSRSQASTLQDNLSKSTQIKIVKQRLLLRTFLKTS